MCVDVDGQRTEGLMQAGPAGGRVLGGVSVSAEVKEILELS